MISGDKRIPARQGTPGKNELAGLTALRGILANGKTEPFALMANEGAGSRSRKDIPPPHAENDAPKASKQPNQETTIMGAVPEMAPLLKRVGDLAYEPFYRENVSEYLQKLSNPLSVSSVIYENVEDDAPLGYFLTLGKQSLDDIPMNHPYTPEKMSEEEMGRLVAVARKKAAIAKRRILAARLANGSNEAISVPIGEASPARTRNPRIASPQGRSMLPTRQERSCQAHARVAQRGLLAATRRTNDPLFADSRMEPIVPMEGEDVLGARAANDDRRKGSAKARFVYCHDLALHPKLRGKHFAKPLIEKTLVKAANELGVDKAVLIAIPEARNFWRREGFRPVPQELMTPKARKVLASYGEGALMMMREIGKAG